MIVPYCRLISVQCINQERVGVNTDDNIEVLATYDDDFPTPLMKASKAPVFSLDDPHLIVMVQSSQRGSFSTWGTF